MIKILGAYVMVDNSSTHLLIVETLDAKSTYRQVKHSSITCIDLPICMGSSGTAGGAVGAKVGSEIFRGVGRE